MRRRVNLFAQRWGLLVFLINVGGVPESGWATEQTTGRITDSSTVLEQRIGRVKLKGSGRLLGDTQRLRGGLEITHLQNTPWFLTGEARFDQERREPYDLRLWGGEGGLGYAFSETTSIVGTYRLDHDKVFNTGSNADPAFRSVEGRSITSAMAVAFRHDSRDDGWYPTHGLRATVGGEVALKAFGGDYDFGRIETDVAYYHTPFRDRDGGFLKDLTFVEHAKVGWVENFGGTDDVPFFERYFVGGTATVRGHRPRWLTPRGLEQQFVGGEIIVVNNLEARIPVLPSVFHRRLSAATFFDVGRTYHRFSEIGDFGYGVGGGLRYVLKVWGITGVVRADVGLNVDREGDDSRARWHLSLGMPF